MGSGPSAVVTSLEPLARGGLGGRQRPSPGEQPGKRPRDQPQGSQPHLDNALDGSAAPKGWTVADSPGVKSSFSASTSAIGSDSGPPDVPGSQGSGEPDVGLRRSSRSWKPSSGCLESLAFMSREVAQAERVMDQQDVAQVEEAAP